MRQKYAILWILPYAVILAIPELIMDLVATSKNFVTAIHAEASLLYDDLDASLSDSDDTLPSDIDSRHEDHKED
jgi:predicted transcriptional regulator